MATILFAALSILVFRFRSRVALELKVVALEHQLTVLRRQRPGRPQLSSLDRLLWVLLYRIWPRVIDAMVLVKPATVVAWHRKGFRFYWRWRSRGPGRPRISADIRDLIRLMSKANPLWGAPRIHGELLKLGIKISQATVGRWMPWRPKVPSPTWRSFLRRGPLPRLLDAVMAGVLWNWRRSRNCQEPWRWRSRAIPHLPRRTTCSRPISVAMRPTASVRGKCSVARSAGSLLPFFLPTCAASPISPRGQRPRR